MTGTAADSPLPVRGHTKPAPVPVIEYGYRDFLLENHDPDEREYPDAADLIVDRRQQAHSCKIRVPILEQEGASGAVIVARQKSTHQLHILPFCSTDISRNDAN